MIQDSVQAKEPLMREVSSAGEGRDITRPFIAASSLLVPQDPVLQGRGGDYTLYEDLLRDDQVASAFQQRRLAVTSAEWGVVPGDERKESQKAADHLREMLLNIGWDRITDKMLYGLFYGYGVAECLWERQGSRVELADIVVRKQRRFAFDNKGNLVLRLVSDHQGELLPEKKFWHFSAGADNDDEPYGLGLAHWLYWPVYFKRNGIKMWSIFMDKFGMPTAKGSYPANATVEENSALRAIHTDSGIIVPENMQVELIEASRGGNVSYENFLDRMNRAIAKVVLSQTMTIEADGGQFKAQVQKSVRDEVLRRDASLISNSFNSSVVCWLTGWNYPDAALPRVWRRISDENDLRPRAERDKMLFDMGFRPSISYIQETYGEGWHEVEKKSDPAGKLD
jgi:phage gp29-like protein